MRQSLYSYANVGISSSNGTLPANKAEVAAQSLTMIYPLVNAKGIVMNIPTLSQATINELEIQQLETLIIDADVLFLVTDTRESRWLPSVLGLRHDKVVFLHQLILQLVLTIAIGFDSFIVMRNGTKADTGAPFSYTTANTRQLGCYFCQDPYAIPDGVLSFS